MEWSGQQSQAIQAVAKWARGHGGHKQILSCFLKNLRCFVRIE